MFEKIIAGKHKDAVVMSILAVLIAGNDSRADEMIHWGYSGEAGPEHWAELSPEYAVCGTGVNQSPVNISDTVVAELDPLELDYQGSSTTVINNGHTLQVDAKPGSSLRVGTEVFQLLQLHFHSPSEHHVDGKEFLLEAHFVHQNEQGEIAVVAVLFGDGSWNADLEKIGDAAPDTIGQSVLLDINFAELKVHTRLASYFRYNGSFTTPPCTEGVRWYVLKETGTMSPDQAARYVDLIGEDARGPQPLNARIVLER